MADKIMQIGYNYSVRREPVKYIVVHDTGNTSKGADAMAHYNYFNSGDRQSSADFFVDDKRALCVNDYHKYYFYRLIYFHLVWVYTHLVLYTEGILFIMLRFNFTR